MSERRSRIIIKRLLDAIEERDENNPDSLRRLHWAVEATRTFLISENREIVALRAIKEIVGETHKEKTRAYTALSRIDCIVRAELNNR